MLLKQNFSYILYSEQKQKNMCHKTHIETMAYMVVHYRN